MSKVESIGNEQLEVIRYLTSTSVPILFIDNELFAVHEFIPLDNNVPRTVIVGINITDIILQHISGSRITAQQQTQLVQQVENAPVERREYSSHFAWTLYS